MAKTSAAAKAKIAGDFIMKLLVGLLFVCIGIEGIAGGDTGANELYRAIGNDVANTILGIVLIVCGLLIAVPLFIRGIKPTFTRYSTIVVFIVWVLVIVFADIMNIGSYRGMEYFEWAEGFIYHLLILNAIYGITKKSFVAVAKTVAGK